MSYIRFESPHLNPKGRRPGIFAMANDLARSGKLSPGDWMWWRSNNDWFDAAYIDPATVDKSLFDKTLYPHATCWFKDSASHLLERVGGYLGLLDRYGVPWIERREDDPGRILYEDIHQVVVTPYETRPYGHL